MHGMTVRPPTCPYSLTLHVRVTKDVGLQEFLFKLGWKNVFLLGGHLINVLNPDLVSAGLNSTGVWAEEAHGCCRGMTWQTWNSREHICFLEPRVAPAIPKSRAWRAGRETSARIGELCRGRRAESLGEFCEESCLTHSHLPVLVASIF